MTIIQKTLARNAIRKIARMHGISAAQCRSEIAAAIAEAWATTDPEIHLRQIQMVGEDRVPTPEELIILVSGLIR